MSAYPLLPLTTWLLTLVRKHSHSYFCQLKKIYLNIWVVRLLQYKHAQGAHGSYLSGSLFSKLGTFSTGYDLAVTCFACMLVVSLFRCCFIMIEWRCTLSRVKLCNNSEKRKGTDTRFMAAIHQLISSSFVKCTYTVCSDRLFIFITEFKISTIVKPETWLSLSGIHPWFRNCHPSHISFKPPWRSDACNCWNFLGNVVWRDNYGLW